jgi:predicted HTH transcriptional regulator
VWIFAKRIDDLAEADLVPLLGTRENQFVEFKEIMYARKDPAARFEMLRDVSSIANAEGGVLIIGMAENGDGEATGIVPVADARVEADRLVSVCLMSLAEYTNVHHLKANPA